MSSTKENIFKLIAQIRAIAKLLQANQSEIDGLEDIEILVRENDLSEEELVEIQNELVQALKELLVVQDQSIKEIQAINAELTKTIELAKALKEELENTSTQI